MRTYECTILVKTDAIRADAEGTLAAIRQIYSSEGAEWIELTKWEERKLAYPIKGQTSALYLFGYFNVDPLKITAIERKADLADAIIRQLIVARPGKDFERIKDQRAKAAERAAAEAAAEAAAAAAAAQAAPQGMI